MVPQPQRWSCHACRYRWPLPDEALESDLVRNAFALTAAAHRDSAGAERTVEVAHLLWEEGYGEQGVAAGLLHDVVEHACIGFGELEAQVGHEVAGLVDALTEEEHIQDFEKRKLVHRARVTTGGRRTAVIYGAAKLACLRDLRAAYAREGECVARRLEASLDEQVVNADRDIRMLERTDPPLPFVEELKEEVAGLRADRAAARRKGAHRGGCRV